MTNSSSENGDVPASAVLGEALGRIANVENAAANADILIKQCLALLSRSAEHLVQIEARLAKPADSGQDAQLAAIQTAALLRFGQPEGDFADPVFVDGGEDWRALLARHRPELFPLWLRLFEASLPFYEKSVEASCSTWSNRFAVAFRDYLRIFSRGNLLDIGSGILARPVYLEGYPARLLHGLDPRPASGHSDFTIACGVNEFLPWADGSFQTVCNATSLDHVIDLERSLAETARVLAANGRFVIWYAHISGAPPPEAKMQAGIDAFHLFHINDDWFAPMIEKHFSLVDRRAFSSGGFSHVFAAYEKR